MQIKQEYIDRSEELLLPEGCHFDDERVSFIRRMESGDLLAVPGRGKTTALRAKLYCMAQNLQLNEGDNMPSTTNNLFEKYNFGIEKEAINEGKEIQECVKELSTGYPRLQMVGVNCTKPEYVASLIKEMKQGTDLPIGVYPNSGLIYDAKTKTWTQPEDILDFGSYATEYLEAGAVAVGGCCTTDVDQIKQVVQAKEQYLNKSL